MRLAIYAHFGESQTVARYVLHILKAIRSLGFEICFVSNSPVSIESQTEVSTFCQKFIQRENTGYDFAMWQAALAEYDLSKFDELLLTNSSIIGPLQPMAALWQKPEVNQCDFWGLTDNDQIAPHLSSYFLVFKGCVIQSNCFAEFWKSVLPYSNTNKDQIIRSYEVGLTIWLEQNGFRWKPLYPQCEVFKRYIESRKNRSVSRKVIERLKRRGVPAQLPGRSTTWHYPDLLIQSGMPFLKTSVLKTQPDLACQLLQSSSLPKEALEELLADMRSA